MSVASIPAATADSSKITPKPAPGVSAVRKDATGEAKAPATAAVAAKPATVPATAPASPEANQAALTAASANPKLDVTPSGFSTFKMSA
jgi:hypothetical protein